MLPASSVADAAGVKGGRRQKVPPAEARPVGAFAVDAGVPRLENAQAPAPRPSCVHAELCTALHMPCMNCCSISAAAAPISSRTSVPAPDLWAPPFRSRAP
eukprot:CAMPEP_0204571696 /NCGR_PEP_ID=MMETSP0661-20131031/39034_1 /ASSEMBLY_ACC=CAM_ASM_000606 /TAXON_ID=109239 /ORGANISM="Alexandrium margalefi, Strain AMGDE01CS-322" /LENGTH=100 /DNA_ID=CAMNT_0051579977 /DNA_START=112 /DNA_END=411 /DNA_ORIENTATION=-